MLIKVPFAQSGDKAEVPLTDAAGGVNMTQGYPAAYSKDPETDPSAKRIDRETFNGLMNLVTSAINELQTNGVKPFITAAENGNSAFVYGEGVPVLYNGKLYVSRAAGNTALPTDTTKWWAMEEYIRDANGFHTEKTPDFHDNSQKVATTEFVAKELGNLAGKFRIPNDGTAVNKDMAGKVIQFTQDAAGHPIVLPRLSTMREGDKFTFLNTSATAAKIQPMAGDKVFIGPDEYTSNITALSTGDTWELVAYPGIGWMTVGGTVLLAHSDKFKTSKAGNGYQVLPSGLIIQWMRTAAISTGTNLMMNFPIPFPTSCANVVAGVVGTANNAVNGPSVGVTYDGVSATVFSWGPVSIGSGATVVAIGW